MMIDNQTTTQKTPEFYVKVQGSAQQLFVVEVARARGIEATFPARSRHTIALQATEEEVRHIVEKTAKLARVYQLKMLEVMVALLAENHLQVPAELTRALALAEAKSAVALAAAKEVQTVEKTDRKED